MTSFMEFMIDALLTKFKGTKRFFFLTISAFVSVIDKHMKKSKQSYQTACQKFSFRNSVKLQGINKSMKATQFDKCEKQHCNEIANQKLKNFQIQ